MFLNPKKYLLTMKEKDSHVKEGKGTKQDIFQIILLNYNDIKSVNDTTKTIFKNKEVEKEIANPVILIKSFDMEVTYVCFWNYVTLQEKINLLLNEDGTLDEYYNMYISCKRVAIENNVILDSTEFLDMFALKIKEKFILDIGTFSH